MRVEPLQIVRALSVKCVRLQIICARAYLKLLSLLGEEPSLCDSAVPLSVNAPLLAAQHPVIRSARQEVEMFPLIR